MFFWRIWIINPLNIIEKQRVQAIRRGVRIVNREPGDRINTGFPDLSYAPWYYFGTKIAMSKNE